MLHSLLLIVNRILSRLFSLLKSFFAPKELDAARAWQVAGGDILHPYWMYAAPVHLTLGRDNFFMSEPAPLPLEAHEVDALLTSLNAYFSETNGMHFYVKDNRWYLGLDSDPRINVMSLQQVLNRDVASAMPTGEGALAWAKLQNEIQMLLSQHPINQARESIGQPIVNSLWCYGLGQAQS